MVSTVINPEIKPGTIYEDCSYHPVLCTERKGNDLQGISLIDGTWPRGCSTSHCGAILLTTEEAYGIVKAWNAVEDKSQLLGSVRPEGT